MHLVTKLIPLALSVGLLFVACGGASSETSGLESAPADIAGAGAKTQVVASLGDLGEGFIVWESSRSGAWRIWKRDLASGSVTQLTPDEPRSQHCCAHIAPGGSHLTYLSLQGPNDEYPDGRTTGELRVVSADGSDARIVGPARIHHENRAAVWRDDRRLIYIEGSGKTVQFDLDSGQKQAVVAGSVEEYGWLPDPTLSHATMGQEPTFSRLEGQSVVRAPALTGCQPYFTQDGRWGFWTGGGGGPIYRLALGDGTADAGGGRHPEIVIAKNDPRLPEDRRYLYFPMVSRDGRFLTWGASPNQHDHYKADYDIYVAEVDADTLELVGDPIRVTDDPATDRYADIFVEPLELGAQRGEAPLTVDWSAPEGGNWSWDLGDGSQGQGGSVSHVYKQPGVYPVTATRGGTALAGRALVLPAMAPELLGWSMPDPQSVALDFNEPIEAGAVRVEGLDAASVGVDTDQRRLLIRARQPIQELLRLEVAGLRDLAQVANEAPTLTIDIDPTLWPIEQESTLLTWTGVGGWNTIRSGAGETEAVEVARRGTATPTSGGGLRTNGGWLEFDRDQSAGLVELMKQTNEFTLELVFRIEGGTGGELLTWGQPVPRNSNLSLALKGGELVAYIKAKPNSRGVDPPVNTFPLPAGLHHLAVLFRPGMMTFYLDGERAAALADYQGDLWHWRDRQLRIGGHEGGGLLPVEFLGLALHRRELTPEQVRDAAGRALRAVDQPEPETWTVAAERIAATPTPSLREISPYTEGLVTRRYRLSDPPDGLPSEVTVVEWGILDGKVLPDPPGRRRLTLQRFSDQPALEGLFLANDFDDDLYYTPPD